MKNKTALPETRKGYWTRILRPLFWWLLLFLMLLGIHQHQLAMERTRIYLSVSMYKTNLLNDAVATLDGHPIGNGDNISLGSHQLTISQAKAEQFNTNFFAWYGPHNLGTIDLKRAMGTLNITAEATAKEITIVGPEYAKTLDNSSGANLVVPTDTYRVSARYARWSDEKDSVVTAGNTTPCTFAPQLSVVSVTCNKSPATFELSDPDGNSVEKGDVPNVVGEVPSGRYMISAVYHNFRLKQGVFVTNKGTNDIPFHFAFGAAQFESTPPGAGIYAMNGDLLGRTPVVIAELPVGKADYRLQLDGYDAAPLSVTVSEDQTNPVNITLVSLSYLGSIRNAKQYMASGNYRSAVASIAQALVAKPNDADALSLQTTAKDKDLMQTAKELANQGDYIGAGQKLQEALTLIPDDAEAKSLQADYKVQEPAQMKEQQTRSAFHEAWMRTPNASLFDANEYKTSRMSPEDAKNALIRLYTDVMPKAFTSTNYMMAPGIYEAYFIQGSLNPAVTARREMLCVFGPAREDGQTLIMFKCLEYQNAKDVNLVDLFHGKLADWVPLNPSRIQMTPAFEQQVRYGISMMNRKIKQAVGETSSY